MPLTKKKYNELNQYLAKVDLPFLGGIINNINELNNKNNDFDIILLFNVLHEIDITEWENEINLLLGLLKDGGLLVLSEKKVLSEGEKPYGKSGYIILSDNELKKLFNFEYIQKASKDKDPFVTFVIKKNQDINNITIDNILEALKELEKNTEAMLFSVLDGKIILPSRKYAFYCQQHINAKHALKILAGKNNKFELPYDFVNWNLPLIMEIEDKEKEYWLLNKRAALYDDETAKECRKELMNRRNRGN